MMTWLDTLRGRVTALTEDEKSNRILRGCVLFILFLALTLAVFFALQQWNNPADNMDLNATAEQEGVYTVGSALLVAGLITTAMAALGIQSREKRPAWYAPLAAGGLALALWILGYAYLGVWPLGFKSILMVDMYHQYAPLLSELRSMLLGNSGDFSYNFNLGMGAAFVPTYAYYLSSPLNLLLALFAQRYLTEAILVITLLKGAVAAAAFTALVQHLYRRRDAAMVAVGLLYSLSGYMLAYSWNIMWLDVVALLPAVVLAMEHMLSSGKVLPYAALLGLALFSNYYIGFMLCVFLVLYMLVWLWRQKRGIKEAGIGCLRFAGGSLWGGALAAILLIPTALSLGRTSAAGGGVGEFGTNMALFDLLGRFFYGATPTIRSGNLPNLYCGVAAVLLLPIYLTQKQIPLRRRMGFGALLTVLLFSCTLTQWDLVWHGLHSPNDLPYRFSFLVSFVLLVMVAQVLADPDRITPRQVLGSLLGSAGYLFLWEKLGDLTATADPDLGEKVATTPELLYGNLVLLGLYAVVLLIGALRRAPATVTSRLVLALVCLELVLATPATLVQMNKDEYFTRHQDYLYNYEHVAIDAALRRAEELAAAEAETEGTFFRMEYEPSITCVPTSLHHYSGLSIFASSSSYLTTKFMGDLGYASNGVNSYLYNSFVAPVDSLLGLRYLVHTAHIVNHPQLTKVDTVTTVNPDTEEEYTYYIYKNEAALPVAYAASNTIREYQGVKYAPFESQQVLFQHLTGLTDAIYHPVALRTEDALGTVNGSSFGIDDAGTVRFSADITEQGQYFVYVDCRAAKNFDVYAYTETGDRAEIGNNLAAHEPYILDMGVLKPGASVAVDVEVERSCVGNVYVVRLDTAAMDKHLAVLRQGGMLVIEQTGHSLTGTVTAKENQDLFFSLPYDKGWQVYVDGSPVETFPIASDREEVLDDEGNWVEQGGDDGAMLGAAIPAGTHTVYAVYRAPGQTLGVLITLAALLPLVALPLGQWLLRRRAIRRTVVLAVKDDAKSE